VAVQCCVTLALGDIVKRRAWQDLIRCAKFQPAAKARTCEVRV
jgi:hypothetical protein